MVPLIVKFWSYLIFLIPSIICLLFILYHLLFDRTLRRALHNHIVIVLLFIVLICEMTIYPWLLYFLQYQGIWERSLIFCEIWGFIDWGFYVTYTILLAWSTIERHILIFHDRWILTKQGFFVHYFIQIFLLFYCIIFYGVVFFFSPCQNLINLSTPVCLFICLTSVYGFGMSELIVNNILPVLIILVFSVALPVRVIWQKHRINQPIQWRKYRKMTVQILSISFLYLVFYLPYTIVSICRLCGAPINIFYEFLANATFLSYFLFLLFPFVCVFSLSELRTKITKIFSLRQNARRIADAQLTARIPRNNRVTVY